MLKCFFIMWFMTCGSLVNAQTFFVRQKNEKAEALVWRTTKKKCSHPIVELTFGKSAKNYIVFFQQQDDNSQYGYLLIPQENNKYKLNYFGRFIRCFGGEIHAVFVHDINNDGAKELFVLWSGACKDLDENGSPGMTSEFYANAFNWNGDSLCVVQTFKDVYTAEDVKSKIRATKN